MDCFQKLKKSFVTEALIELSPIKKSRPLKNSTETILRFSNSIVGLDAWFPEIRCFHGQVASVMVPADSL